MKNRVQEYKDKINNLIEQNLQIESSYENKRKGDIYLNSKKRIKTLKLRYDKELKEVFTKAEDEFNIWDVGLKPVGRQLNGTTLFLYLPVSVGFAEICDYYQLKYSREVSYLKIRHKKVIGFPRNEETEK